MGRSPLGSPPACRKGKVVRDEQCPQFSVGDASIPSNVWQNSFIAVYRSSQLRNTPSNGKICESRQNESRHATPPFDPGDPSWTDSTGKSSPRWKRMDAAPSPNWARQSAFPNRPAGRESADSKGRASFARSEEHKV